MIENPIILILSPHTDDMELAAGGTIARWIEEDKTVYSVAFSIAEKSLLGGLPENTLEKEVGLSAEVLGIPESNLFIYKYPVRDFPRLRQEILETLVIIRDKLKPNLVLLPSLNDIHQDHHTIAEEGIRAFKTSSIIAYEQPWNLYHFSSQLFITLEKRHLEKKLQAIACYQSQKKKNYVNEEFILGLAKVRGVQINCDYAEAFEVIRWIIEWKS